MFVGVAVAAGGQLLWTGPDPERTALALDRGTVGGAEAGGVPTSTGTTTTTSASPEPTTSVTTSSTPADEPESSQPSSPPSDPGESATTDEDDTGEETTATTARSDSGSEGAGDLPHRVVALVNAERADAGCRSVRVDGRLAGAAQGHSDDMAENGYLSHTSQDGRSFSERIEAEGYPSPAAENIAMGMSTPEAVMDAWMASDGHRRNILNCEIAAIGVGVNPDGWYWTQNFGY
ncbi:CAP domain-containing protein [Saccharomonospora xinjiangensis]|nr:Cysteine-rich secretory protein family protein [Saccharomonospora xinjiangensis]